MAKRNSYSGPPDLRGLANRRLIDPADMPTNSEVREPWPVETAEVELLPTTTEADLPAVPVLGPPLRPIPILSASQARAERRRSSKWVGNLVLVSVGFGLLGGITFAVSALWYLEPTSTERWFSQATEWLSALSGEPPSEAGEEVGLAVEDGLEPPRLELSQAVPSDELPVEDEVNEEVDGVATEELAVDDEAEDLVEAEAPIEPDAHSVAPEPDPVVARERIEETTPAPVVRRRAPARRPAPSPVPLPQPTVRPYAERPKPGEPPAPRNPVERDEHGLLIER